MQAFNACAVSAKQCVPQRVDEGVWPVSIPLLQSIVTGFSHAPELRCGLYVPQSGCFAPNYAMVKQHTSPLLDVQVPPDCSLDEKFDLGMFQGRWYITAGLNPLFDTFPCQEHYFGVPEPGMLYAHLTVLLIRVMQQGRGRSAQYCHGDAQTILTSTGKLYGKIQWRIMKDNGDFLERNTVQTFKQQVCNPHPCRPSRGYMPTSLFASLHSDLAVMSDVRRLGYEVSMQSCCTSAQANPAVLWNHDNDYLHYSDDWYILASKPDEYLLIYYKGNNDAWKGYGGATVYTRHDYAQHHLSLALPGQLRA